jgi:hypothetical protein
MSANLGLNKRKAAESFEQPKTEKKMDFGTPNGNSTQNNHSLNTSAEMADMIQKFKSIENPSNQDLMSLMLSVLETCTNTNNRVAKIEEISSQVEINTERLDKVEEKLENLEFSQMELDKKLSHENSVTKSENNYLLQKDLDKDVIITGFNTAPNEEDIVNKLCEKLNFPINKVFTTESWSSTQDHRTKGFMIITFKSKSAQIQFMKKKFEFGNIAFNELMGNEQSDDVILLRFNSRLTQLNHDIRKKLWPLLKDKKIAQIKYRNCFFNICKESHSALLPITSLEMLQNLFEPEIAVPEQTTY